MIPEARGSKNAARLLRITAGPLFLLETMLLISTGMLIELLPVAVLTLSPAIIRDTYIMYYNKR